jgi:vacuolar-type H+-ATPase subunit D/Vma8
MKLKYIFLIFSVLLLAVACAKPPTADMDSAREAVSRAANDPDVVKYGSNSLSLAQSALINMQAAADSKRYDDAKSYAANATMLAERAVTEARAEGVRLKNEAAFVISGLKPEIEETSKNVNGARYSLLDLDYDTLDRTIVNAYDTSDQAEVDQALGKYQDALNKANGVRSDLSNINNMVANAVVRKKG